MTHQSPCRAIVTLKISDPAQAQALTQALAVEAHSDDGPTQVELKVLKGGRIKLTIEALRLSLLRAALKAYLQWAACCQQVSQQTYPAAVPQEQ